MEKVKPVIGRVGGKSRLAPWIIEHLSRFQWSIYCEPFAGSAAVYFRMIQEGIFEQIRDRGHHPRIVLNDADSRIVQLFRTCRDYPELLAYAVAYTPYSREEHRLAQQGYNPSEALTGESRDLSGCLGICSPESSQSSLSIDGIEDEIEQARQYLVDGWQSFKYMPGDSWGVQPREDRGCVDVWHSLPNRILTASPHLQGEPSPVDSPNCLNATGLKWLAGSAVEVEQARRYLVDGWQSFSSISDNSWSFQPGTDRTRTRMNPPSQWHSLPDRILTATNHLKRCYIENDDAVKCIERWATPHTAIYADPPYYDCSHYYKEDFDNDQHARLAECLHTIDAACVIVSYYPHPEILKLYSEDTWERHYKDTVASSAGVTRNSKTKTRPKRTELLLVRKRQGSAPAVNLGGQMGLF